jgi:FtsP/CotA-like multicopper oxidase with cupredoxin domain
MLKTRRKPVAHVKCVNAVKTAPAAASKDKGRPKRPLFLKTLNSIIMQPTKRYFELMASEFDWKISEKTIKAWGFNDSIPGPFIRAKKGDELVVKVKNNLKEPTVVHWHGIRLPSGTLFSASGRFR